MMRAYISGDALTHTQEKQDGRSAVSSTVTHQATAQRLACLHSHTPSHLYLKLGPATYTIKIKIKITPGDSTTTGLSTLTHQVTAQRLVCLQSHTRRQHNDWSVYTHTPGDSTTTGLSTVTPGDSTTTGLSTLTHQATAQRLACLQPHTR